MSDLDFFNTDLDIVVYRQTDELQWFSAELL